MASFTGEIYLITNKINNKIYIGQSSISKKSYFGGGVLIKLAIKKYGKENFEKTILQQNISSQSQLNDLEIYYINLYNSTDPKIGYNILNGGKRSTFKHSELSKSKISKRSLQEDNKKRIREIQKKACEKNKGTKKSKEEKTRMILKKFGQLKEIEIYSKETNEKLYVCNFSSEASELTGVKSSGIRNNLCGLSNSSGGYIFKYKK